MVVLFSDTFYLASEIFKSWPIFYFSKVCLLSQLVISFIVYILQLTPQNEAYKTERYSSGCVHMFETPNWWGGWTHLSKSSYVGLQNFQQTTCLKSRQNQCGEGGGARYIMDRKREDGEGSPWSGHFNNCQVSDVGDGRIMAPLLICCVFQFGFSKSYILRMSEEKNPSNWNTIWGYIIRQMYGKMPVCMFSLHCICII